MRILCATFFIGVISCGVARLHDAAGTSIIPSSPPKPTPTAGGPDGWRSDKKLQSKNVHDFFNAYGWLRHNESIPDFKLVSAIKKIQKMLRVPETGVYDDRLQSIMSRPRCGTIPAYNETDAKEDGIRKRYVVWGPKWDHTPITYRFLNFTADLSADIQRSIVSAAFAKWTQFLPVSITQAPANAARADIHIRFMSMGPNETAYAFTNMIADGLALSSGLINITFNDDYNWSDDRMFNFTAVHEIGHSLGLSHSKVEEAVMFAYYEGIIRPIHPDDQAAIHTAYGWKEPRWNRIDATTSSKKLIQVSSVSAASAASPSIVDGLYQLRSTGQILWYNPNGGWTSVDNNKDTAQITGANGYLYKRHSDGSTHKYSGSGTSWQQIGAASDNVIDIVAAADQVYARRKDGWIARWNGTGLTWVTIQQPSAPVSKQIAITDSKTLWNLLTNGDLVRSEWPYTADSWQIVDLNAANTQIATGGEEFYKLQTDGNVVWLNMKEYYWNVIETANSTAIYAVGMYLYSRHNDGSIWRYTGTPGVWEQLDSRADSLYVIGDRKGAVYEMLNSGDIYKLVS